LSRWASSAALCGLASAFAGVLLAVPVFAQAAPGAPAQQATRTKSPYVFSGDAAITLNFIKADKTADFEVIVGKLKDALQTSAKPERAQQAASWTVYKATEPGPGGSSIYVFLIDPVAKDSDYTPSTILSEGFPQGVQPLYKTLSGSYASQTILNLTLVSDFGR
jgi:hypothetical protein